jgi:hypothetical protein
MTPENLVVDTAIIEILTLADSLDSIITDKAGLRSLGAGVESQCPARFHPEQGNPAGVDRPQMTELPLLDENY